MNVLEDTPTNSQPSLQSLMNSVDITKVTQAMNGTRLSENAVPALRSMAENARSAAPNPAFDDFFNGINRMQNIEDVPIDVEIPIHLPPPADELILIQDMTDDDTELHIEYGDDTANTYLEVTKISKNEVFSYSYFYRDNRGRAVLPYPKYGHFTWLLQ